LSIGKYIGRIIQELAEMNNPNLQTPKAPAGWKGTPVDEKGRFSNLHHPFEAKLMDVLRWQLEKNPFKQAKKAERWNPAVMRDDSWLDGREDVIVWLGHSTFYIRIDGICLLTDPVFGDIFTVKRQTPFPLDVHRLINLDYILLSHDHRDHLDEESLKILSVQNPDVRYLTGLGMQSIVHRFTKSDKIEEAGWYQQYTDTNITFIPSRHWSKRGAFDTNKRLWGGFVIASGEKRILFGGDSGYDTHYKELAAVFGGFDYAILGIGAYEPAWFMGANHQSPEDALKAAKELNARYFIPMHYATFDLSDEPLGQPLKELRAAAGNDDSVKVLKHGEAIKPVYAAYSGKPV
jgi:L-ascorbate metabolism protein UlaG (beta-lactamase superfamily)